MAGALMVRGEVSRSAQWTRVRLSRLRHGDSLALADAQSARVNAQSRRPRLRMHSRSASRPQAGIADANTAPLGGSHDSRSHRPTPHGDLRRLVSHLVLALAVFYGEDVAANASTEAAAS